MGGENAQKETRSPQGMEEAGGIHLHRACGWGFAGQGKPSAIHCSSCKEQVGQQGLGLLIHLT